MISTTIILSMSLMGVLASYLVLDRRYEDGLIGRIALVFGMIVPAFLTSMLALEALLNGNYFGDAVKVEALVAIFLVGAAVFMSRHVYRFLRYRFCGEGNWRNRPK